MTLIDENMAEQAALDWFEELGYERVFGPERPRLMSGKLRITEEEHA